MNLKPIKTFLIIIFLLSCTSIYSHIENEVETGTANTEFIDKVKRKDWILKLAPYAWLARTATDVGGEKIRQSFNDLTSLTNFGFQIIAQAKNKNGV